MKRLFVSAVFGLVWFASASFGQDPQYTKDKADQMLRSTGRVNPSTLGMEFDLPMGNYPGRGVNMPISLSYSSKVWEVRVKGNIPSNAPGGCRAYYEPIYSQASASGWTSSLGVAYIEYVGKDRIFTYEGFPYESYGCGQFDTNQNRSFIKRIIVHLPSGETHELRVSDDPQFYDKSVSSYLNQSHWNATYYAVDGSNLKYVEDSSTNTYHLMMPDGSYYDFATSSGTFNGVTARKLTQYTDRNGNYLSFNASTGVWTDTLGRTFTAPLGPQAPTSPTTAQSPQTYSLPGLTSTYKLQWKYLKGSSAAESGLTDFNQSLRYPGSSYRIYQSPWLAAQSPYLFDDGVVSDQTLFNPIVLTEIELPTGQKYKFTYDVFGRVESIAYPTGGSETFTYQLVPPLGFASSPGASDQVNYGVLSRKVYESTGAVPSEWTYQVAENEQGYKVSETAPDQTKTERSLHRDFSECLGCETGTWGYSSGLAGRPYEELHFSSDGHLVSRKLTHWTTTQFIVQSGTAYADWHPRVDHEESIVYDFSGSGVSTTTKIEYEGDLSSRTTPLLVKKRTEYAFVTKSDGATYSPGATPNPYPTPVQTPTPPTVTRISESTFLINDPNYSSVSAAYKARNIVGLVTVSKIKDSSGAVKAQTETVYDEVSYLVTDFVGGTVPGWASPATTVRGLPTTTKRWYDIANNLSISTRTQYDQFGNVRKNWDGKGNVSEVQYIDRFSDSVNRYTYAFATKTISPIPGGNGSTSAFQAQTTYSYPAGLVLNVLDVNGQTTTMEYNDALLRPTKVTAPNGQQTITEYGAGTDSSSRWVRVKSQIDGSSWKEAYTWYDGLMRNTKTQSVDPTSGDVFVETQYDNMSRAKKVSNPYRTNDTIYWTENTFDTAGRLWKVTTSGDNAVVETTYGIATLGSCVGTVVIVEDQADKQRRSITNSLGQLCRVDEPTTTGTNLGSISSPNQPTSYSYDLLNNLTNVTQGGQTRGFVYDAMSRLKSASNPESGNVSYGYDNNGNLTSKTDARPTTTTYTYDALNRVQTRSYNDGITPTATYYYDNLTNAKGKLIKTTNANSTTEYTSFDILGRVTGHKQTTDGTAYETGYTYNLAGALVEETYPSGRVVKNVLDPNGDLALVESKKNAGSGFWAYANSFTYNAAGAVTSMQLGNGKWESTTFNSRLRPTQIALGTTPNATNVLDLDYTYGSTNNNGNVLSQTITVPGLAQPFVQNYTYDELNRLASATETNNGTGTWNQVYGYDRYGNRNITSGTGVTSFSFSGNRITAHSFDAAGNTTNNGTNTFAYDAENKQISVNSGAVGQYWYDADGKRVKKYVPGTSETTVFVYDAAGKVVAEYSTNVMPAQDAKVAYLTADHLGSPRVNTNANGVVTSRHDYRPFGEEILTAQRATSGYDADTVRKQFTGYERDNEAGLDFAQARYYSNGLGRFLSEDPFSVILESQSESDDSKDSGKIQKYISKPQVWNKYASVMNNPMRFVDPSGEDALVVVFTNYRIEVSSGPKVPGIGHAGIVLINEDGSATYYEYGRYDEEEKGLTRLDFKGPLPKLEFTADGVATEQSVTKLMTALSEKYGQGGAIEGAYFNTSQATTDAMRQHADGRLAQNTDPGRTPYSLLENQCMTFTRDVLQGGGVSLNTTRQLPAMPDSKFGTAKTGGLEPSSSGTTPIADIGYLQGGTYSIPRESKTGLRPGRIPYKPNK